MIFAVDTFASVQFANCYPLKLTGDGWFDIPKPGDGWNCAPPDGSSTWECAAPDSNDWTDISPDDANIREC